MTLRAITVRQPWASAIAWGAKTVENRAWPTKWRGQLAIHAGSAYDRRAEEFPPMCDALAVRTDPGLAVRQIPYGAVLAVVRLVDVHPSVGCCEPWGETAFPHADGRERREVFHWVLDDVRPLAVPVPVPGRLGLWRLHGEPLAAVRAGTP